MRKKKQWEVVKNVPITDIDDKGRGIGKKDGLVYFVDSALPDSVVDVLPLRKKKSVLESVVHATVKESPHKRTPHCIHFENCGGCRTQHLSYEAQLHFKEKHVKDVFERIAHFKDLPIKPILACEVTEGYRNKLEFSFSNKRWLTEKDLHQTQQENTVNQAVGFHIAGLFDKVLHISKCHHTDDFANELRNFIYEYAIDKKLSFYDLRAHKGLLRTLIIRNTADGQWLILLSFGENQKDEINKLLTALKNQFDKITSLYYCINTKLNDTLYDIDLLHFSGETFIVQQIGSVQLEVGPSTFVQVNNYQTETLYEQVKKMADLQGNEVVYDLFCGVGSIGFYLADKCKEVLGIETVEEAILSAEKNKTRNNISNIRFFCGSVEHILTDDFANQFPHPDVVITDPPRTGMHPKVIAMLLKLRPKTIVYVSCKPATQARDVELLSEAYHLVDLQPVDMFPHTTHVESIALLKLI